MRLSSFLVPWLVSLIGAPCSRLGEGIAPPGEVTEDARSNKSDVEAPHKKTRRGLGSIMKALVVGAHSKKNAKDTELTFKHILLDDEEVAYSWKALRNYLILTDRRVIVVEKEGISAAEYTTYGYSQILRFSVTTAGPGLDLTACITFWVRRTNFKVELDKSTASLFEASRFLSEKLIRERVWVNAPPNPKPDMSSQKTARAKSGANTSATSAAYRLADKMVLVDPDELEAKLKAEVEDVGPVLLADEKVQIAYKGFVDLLVFTDKRIVIQDRSWSIVRSQIPSEYTSVPYAQVMGFSIKTAGTIDFDAEIHIYTRKRNFKQSLRRDMDVHLLYRLLSAYVLHGKTNKNVTASSLVSIEQGAARVAPINIQNMWLGGSSVNATELTQKLSSDPTNILMPGETVIRGIEQVRDTFIITSDRILNIDVQGVTGVQKEYKTCLLETITELEVIKPGKRDLDAEIFVQFEDEHHLKARLNRAEDVTVVGSEIAKLMLESQPEVPADDEGFKSSIFNGMLGGFRGRVEKIEKDLRDLNALFDEEAVHSIINVIEHSQEKMIILTSKRLLIVGMAEDLSPRLAYRSIPYHCILNFETVAVPATQVGVPPGRADKTHLVLHVGSNAAHTVSLAFGGTADLPRFSRMLASRILKRYESRASKIENLVNADSWQGQPAGWLGAHFGGFVDERDEIEMMLSTPPFQLLISGERVIVAYVFARETRSQLVLTQWRIMVVQQLQDQKLLIKSVPYDSVDTFMVAPGLNPMKKTIQGIEQRFGGSLGQLTITDRTNAAPIINAEVRFGQNVLDLARFLAKFGL